MRKYIIFALNKKNRKAGTDFSSDLTLYPSVPCAPFWKV